MIKYAKMSLTTLYI